MSKSIAKSSDRCSVFERYYGCKSVNFCFSVARFFSSL